MANSPVTPKVEPEEIASVYLTSARQYAKEGLPEQAIIVLKAALMLQPNNLEVLIFLAASYFELERFNEALAHLQHAYQLDPTDPEPIAGIGEVFLRTARWNEAVEQIEALYPLHQGKALRVIRNLLFAFNDHIFERLLDTHNKQSDKD